MKISKIYNIYYIRERQYNYIESIKLAPAGYLSSCFDLTKSNYTLKW